MSENCSSLLERLENLEEVLNADIKSLIEKREHMAMGKTDIESAKICADCVANEMDYDPAEPTITPYSNYGEKFITTVNKIIAAIFSLVTSLITIVVFVTAFIALLTVILHLFVILAYIHPGLISDIASLFVELQAIALHLIKKLVSLDVKYFYRIYDSL